MYTVVEWPEIQFLFEKEGFYENSCLINDEKGMEEFGSSAYFVRTDWLGENFTDDQTYTSVGFPECQMLEELPEFEEHSYPDEQGGYFIETDWLKIACHNSEETSEDKFERRLIECGLIEEWDKIGRIGRVATEMENSIILFVHEGKDDKYTEIRYPSFDLLKNNETFVQRILNQEWDEDDMKEKIQKWISDKHECPLYPTDVYFHATGIESELIDY